MLVNYTLMTWAIGSGLEMHLPGYHIYSIKGPLVSHAFVFVDIRVFRYYILRGACQNERDCRETAKGGLTDFL